MEEYIGYKTVVLSDDELARFYTMDEHNNVHGLLRNEYVEYRDTRGTLIAVYKCTGAKLVLVPFKQIGSVKPKNVQQQMTIDMLLDKNITVKMLSGRYGSGKDFLMCSAALDMLESGDVEKIVYVRNNIEVKDSKPLGYLPGSSDDKLMPYAMVLADKVGGIDNLKMLLDRGSVEIVHLGFIRGRDIKNSIVYCSEAENMTKEHIQLLLGRIGEGSSLWINGDCRQTDLEVFKRNSGMKIAVEKLAGHPLFGYVQLKETVRSETAAMADLLD